MLYDYNYRFFIHNQNQIGYVKGEKMSLILRYSNIRRGGITFIGNTLGLSKRQDLNQSGTLGSIGAFTSLNNALQVNTFPNGTTSNYLLNGSSAVLNLPVGSTVLYAELIWGGLYRSTTNNIFNLINNPITFTTPLGSNSITSDIDTRQDLLIPIQGNILGFYVRSANVTNLVANALGGNYSVSAVPALIEAVENTTNSTNHAGWTLAVVYENASEELKNLSLWAGGVVVNPSLGSTDITITGFITPPVLPITGKIFVSAGEGDAVLSGDQMLFGINTSNLSTLSGPNNPETNFFASQINGDNGLINTSGSFGTRNANAFLGSNTTACRQGWDITAVDISNKLVVNQFTAAIRFTTNQDLYVPNALALQVESLGANLTATKSVDKQFAKLDEEIAYTILVENTGSLNAQNALVIDDFPSELSLVANSITVDGVTVADVFPINLGTILSNQSKTVKFRVKVNSIPNINPILNIAKINYSFEPFKGFIVNSSTITNQVSTLIINPELNITKSVDKTVAIKGDTLTYKSSIKNIGTLPVSNLTFTDMIPTGTNFLPSSVVINGVLYPSYNPELGFSLPNLEPNEDVNVEFKVIVI